MIARIVTVLLVLLGALPGCEAHPPPASPGPSTPSPPAAVPLSTPRENSDATTPAVPPGALDIPAGGCLTTQGAPVASCADARALPVALTEVPTKLGGLLPLPGGKVHNRSTRDIFAVGSLPATSGAGSWEIVRVPAGSDLGGDLRSGSRQMTTDVDWVSATPPAPDGHGGFTYDPLTVGVKVVDGAELTIVDRPGGGIRFWLSASSKIVTAGQMNGGSPITYVARR